jgi:two-component system cell cycle sensor histidine kinase/response regulator CckA
MTHHVLFERSELGVFRDFPEPVFIIEPSGDILDANSVFAAQFFSSISEIIGLNFFDLLVSVLHDPKRLANSRARIEAVLSTGRYLEFYEDSNGALLRNSIYPVNSPSGKISRLLIMTHDLNAWSETELHAPQNASAISTIINDLPASVFILNENGCLLDCNDNAFKYFCDRQQPVQQSNFFDFVMHEDRQRLKETLSKVLESGIEESNEVRMCLRGNQKEWRWFSINALSTIIDGRPCLVMVCLDIERHKKLEKQLEQKTRWLEMAMDATKTGVWHWSIKTGAIFWSDEILALHGIEKTAGLKPSYKLWESSIHPEDKEKTVSAIKEAIHSKTDLNIRYRVLHGNGSVRWMMACAKPLFNNNAEVKGYFGTIVDITERTLIDEKTESIRANLDFALEKCHIGWWNMNLENHTTVQSLENARIFGYDTIDSRWSYERFIDQVVDEDRAKTKKILTDAIALKNDFNFECRIVKGDDDIRWIWSSGTFQYDSYGNANHLLCIVQDITERKLGEKNQERLQHLLQQSQKMEIVGQLAGGVAHDFNNSLTSILGNIEMLAAHIEKDSPLAEYVKELEKSAQHSAQMTRQLLTFAQKQLRSPKKVFLNHEITRLTPRLRTLLNYDIQLISHFCQDDVCVQIDPAELEQLIISIVVNAGDAITGKGTIEIGTDVVDYDEVNCLIGYQYQVPVRHVKISISDTGNGIDKKALPHIFEPFFTTKSIDKGIGLGLTTAYGVLRQNKGCIDCQTEVGKGTTFTIYLPLYQAEKKESRVVATEKKSRSSNETVLVVEDDSCVLKILVTLLESDGYQVISARDAEGALALAEQQSGNIALLVTDIVLPEMNGVELSEILKEKYPDSKTLFMSGYPLNVLPQNNNISEGVNFIEKPFSVADFKEIVATLIYVDNHEKPAAKAN